MHRFSKFAYDFLCIKYSGYSKLWLVVEGTKIKIQGKNNNGKGKRTKLLQQKNGLKGLKIA